MLKLQFRENTLKEKQDSIISYYTSITRIPLDVFMVNDVLYSDVQTIQYSSDCGLVEFSFMTGTNDFASVTLVHIERSCLLPIGQSIENLKYKVGCFLFSSDIRPNTLYTGKMNIMKANNDVVFLFDLPDLNLLEFYNFDKKISFGLNYLNELKCLVIRNLDLERVLG